jgi:murein DD-endopeptidase MepM/ murein hydrolase activator NlpD
MTASLPHKSRRAAAVLSLFCVGLTLTYSTPTQAARRELSGSAFKSEPKAALATDDGADRTEYARIAEELDLGSRRMAGHLLTRTPERALQKAAGKHVETTLAYPIEHGNFVRGFGYVRKVRKDLIHKGVDIAAKPGTPIHVVNDGIVGYAADGVKGYGNLAIIIHPDGSVSSYAHCSKLLVVPGQKVTRGEVIAEVGTTGISRGPHLHFEYRKGGKPTNPMARFDKDWFEGNTGKAPALAALTR